MRRFKMTFVLLAVPFVSLGAGLLPGGMSAASADEAAPTVPLASRTLSQGYYLLAVSPQTLNGRPVNVKSAFLFPAVIGMKGDQLVVGGKNAPQMRGTVKAGQLSASTTSGGGSFSVSGPVSYIKGQPKGSATSGRFTWATNGGNRLTGTFTMVPVNGFGSKLVSALSQSRNGIGTNSTLTGLAGPEYGYQGPGLFSNLETANLGSVNGSHTSKDPVLQDFGSGKKTDSSSSSSSTDNRSSYQKAKDSIDYGSGKAGGGGTTPDKPAPADEGVVQGAIDEAKKEWNESDLKKWVDAHTSGDERPTYGSGGLNRGGTPGAGGDKGGNVPGTDTGSTGSSGGVNGANGATINRGGNGGDNPFEVQPADVLNQSHLFDGSKDPPPGVAGGAALTGSSALQH